MTINNISNVNPYVNIQNQQSNNQENSVSFSGLSFDEISEIMPTKEKYPDFLKFKEEMLKIDMDSEYTAYLMSSNFSNDENLNSAMYETLKDKPFMEQLGFIIEIESNMADEYNNMNIIASFVMPSYGEESLHSQNTLTQEEKKTIDIDSFISKMIETFTEDFDESKNEQYQSIINGYSSLQKNYQKIMDEKNVLLENLTKNNKENPLLNIE